MDIHPFGAALAGILLILTLSACSVPGLWTYEKEGTGNSSGGGSASGFDADKAWTDQVLPAIQTKGVDAPELLAAIEKDSKAAATEHGVVPAAGGSPTFAIKGSGKVTKVDTEQPTGPVTVDIGDGKTVQIVTGPVILGTALRDIAGITFGDFTNQIDYQNAGTALNNKSKTDVIATLDKSALAGKTLEFQGAFTLLTPTQIAIVPTELKVSG
jgi:predicted lipoprotein